MDNDRLYAGVLRLINAGSVTARTEVYDEYPELLLPEAPATLRSIGEETDDSTVVHNCDGAAQVLELLQQASRVMRSLSAADQAAGVEQMLGLLQLGASKPFDINSL